MEFRYAARGILRSACFAFLHAEKMVENHHDILI
jgi:hypothetical protein